MYYWMIAEVDESATTKEAISAMRDSAGETKERRRDAWGEWKAEMATKEEKARNGRKSLNTGTQDRKKLVVKSTLFRFHRPAGTLSLSLALGISISPRFSSSSIT